MGGSDKSSLSRIGSKSWIRVLAFALTSISSISFAQIVTTNGSDNAGNYSGVWTNGANRGTGFGAWALTTNTNSGYAGTFIGDPNSAGITGFGNNAFGLYAKPDNSNNVSATRSLLLPMAVGQTLSFQWAVNYDSGSGYKGFDLLSDTGTRLLNVNQGGFPGDLYFEGTNGSASSNIGFTYGTSPMKWTFELINPTTLKVTGTSRTNGVDFTTNLAVTAAPKAFKFYANGLPEGDNHQPYFNNLSLTTTNPVRNVTFQVNMSVQREQTKFDPLNDKVFLVGDVAGADWNNGLVMTRVGTTDVYQITIPVEGDSGAGKNFKFKINNNTGLETNVTSVAYGNRTLTLGPTNNPQTNSAYFNNEYVFAVNMGVQRELGKFDPATDRVYLRGPVVGGWGNTNELSRVESTDLYKFKTSVQGNAGDTFEYKFWTDRSGGGYESNINNRTLVLGGADLGTTYFDNRYLFTVDMGTQRLNGNFDPDNDKVYLKGDVLGANGWNNAQELLRVESTDVFRVDLLVDRLPGTTLLYKFWTSSSGFESSIGDRVLTLGATQVSKVYFDNANPPVQSTFTGWLNGEPPTSDLLAQYAYGAYSPSSPADKGNFPTIEVVNGNLVLTYYVRREVLNQSLVVPQVNANDLGNASDWGMVPANNLANVITNRVGGVYVVKKTATVPIDSNSRKFLRLKISE